MKQDLETKDFRHVKVQVRGESCFWFRKEWDSTDIPEEVRSCLWLSLRKINLLLICSLKSISRGSYKNTVVSCEGAVTAARELSLWKGGQAHGKGTEGSGHGKIPIRLTSGWWCRAGDRSAVLLMHRLVSSSPPKSRTSHPRTLGTAFRPAGWWSCLGWERRQWRTLTQWVCLFKITHHVSLCAQQRVPKSLTMRLT